MKTKKDPADFFILVADDSHAARSLNISLVSGLNPYIFEAKDGIEALSILREEDIDLLITDIEMPVMDGIELCKTIRQEFDEKRLPIVVVSMFDSDRDIQRGFEAGADAYILKSQAREQLEQAVRRVYTRHKLNTRQRIILVSENSAFINMVGKILSPYGYTVFSKKTLAFANEPESDLIIIDVPINDGYPPLETLSRYVVHEYNDLPVIYVVPQSYNDYLHILRQRGISLIMSKPFRADELVRNIEQLNTDGYQRLLSDFQHQLEHEAHTRKLLREKEELIKEVHHRVKNNLQIVGSLLSLQLNDLQTRGICISDYPRINHLLSSFQSRIQFMGRVTGVLMDTIQANAVSFRDIMEAALSFDALSKLGISKSKEFEDIGRSICVPIKFGQDIALALYEIFNNVLMHLNQSQKSAAVSARIRSGEPVIIISDNGPGLPKDISFPEGGHVGLTLIQALLAQSGCSVGYVFENGAVYELTFPQSAFRSLEPKPET